MRTAGHFPALAILAAWVVLALAVVLSLAAGARTVPLPDVIAALTSFEPNEAGQVVVRELRLPRTLAGLMVGSALAVAGVILQALTRNPLAEPGLMGINAGASFAVVLAAFVFREMDPATLALAAFPGAGAAAVAVFLLGGSRQGGATPVRLALAGAAMTALLLSLVSALVLVRQEALDVHRFWVVGSLSGAGERPVAALAPAAVAGLALSLVLAGRLDLLAMGEDVARGLGVRTGRVQALALIAATLLTGSAVAVAGPVAFLGLVVPHGVRMVTGPATLRMVALAVPAGAALLLLADVLGRVVTGQAEIRVGIMMALIGGPAFILIVRRMRLGAP